MPTREFFLKMNSMQSMEKARRVPRDGVWGWVASNTAGMGAALCEVGKGVGHG